MCRKGVGTLLDRDEILDFLDTHGLAENAFLIRDVARMLDFSRDCQRVVVCRSGDGLSGVASISWNPDEGLEAGYTGFAYAVDHYATAALVYMLPEGTVGSIRVSDPAMQDYLSRLPGATRRDYDLYFTVDAEHFRPVTGEEVTEVTAADAELIHGCEKPPDWECLAAGTRVFAMLRDGRAASSVRSSPVTPRMPSGRQILCVGALRTETPYRRQGLAKRLVSHVTELILRDGNVPIYWTEPENVASLGLCRGLGYRQYAEVMTFRWRMT